MDVRHVVLRLPGRTGLTDGVSLRDSLAALDEQSTEMSE